jgi:transcriptional regulator with XRE-family HTH domain
MSRRDLARIAQVRADLAAGRAREARIAAGIKVGEVARELGVTPQAVSQWEFGRRVPGAAHALAYGRLLDAVAQVAPPAA